MTEVNFKPFFQREQQRFKEFYASLMKRSGEIWGRKKSDMLECI